MNRKMPRVSLIAAMGSNRAIGVDNGLPWRLPADLRRFKALTTGHTLVMGRKTFESIRGPLPWRTTVVVSRRPDYAPEGVLVAHSVDEALARAARQEKEEVFVAGGEEIFRQTLDRADRMHLTCIEQDFPGDTFFPEFDESAWRLVEREDHEATAEAPFAYSFRIYDRVRGEGKG
jgi:dihydrofolate reductase